MQTIITKYAGPTDTKGSRVIAKCWLGKVTHNWDYSGAERNHAQAAEGMVAKLNSDRIKNGYDDYLWVIVACGSMPDGTGDAYIIDLQSTEGN